MMEPVPSASSSGKMGASFSTVVKRFTMDTFRSRMMGMISKFASCALVLRWLWCSQDEHFDHQNSDNDDRLTKKDDWNHWWSKRRWLLIGHARWQGGEKQSRGENIWEPRKILKITEGKITPTIIIMMKMIIMMIITIKTMIITGAQSRSDLPRGTRRR